MAATIVAAGATAAAEQVGDQQLGELRDQARTVFASANQPESILLFTQLIDALDARAASGTLDESLRVMLIEGLSYRAEAHFNLGEQAAASEDLRRMVTSDPTAELDSTRVSPRLLELFDQLYSELVGSLYLRIFPDDAVARVDNLPFDPSAGPVALLAGPHTVSVDRPGYAPVVQAADVEAAVGLELDIVLERSSAVVSLFTRPVGASVSLGGRFIGVSAGNPPRQVVFQGDAAEVPRAEFSDELVVSDLLPGIRSIEVALEGYRTYREELEIDRLKDYRVVVMLERAVGTILLDGLSDSVTVAVNDETVTPDPPVDSSQPAVPRLTLPIGEHRIAVSDPTAGVFETTVTVEDGVSVVVPIRLRPVLGLLGVVGGDDIGARTLREALDETFESLGLWVVRDRTAERVDVFPEAGEITEALRALARADTEDDDLVDWRAVQATVDARTPANIYVLGVLSDDLLATHADVWVWLAAPSPALPGRVRVAIDAASAAPAIREALAPDLQLTQPWFGASLIDSDAAAGPVVVRVTAGSPAAAAGLEVGDVVTSVAGAPVERAHLVRLALLGLEPGLSATLAVERGGSTKEIAVEISASPLVLALGDSRLLPPTVLMQLGSAAQSVTTDVPEWVVQLNRATVFMFARAWEDAVRALRPIRAPVGPGLGQAAVDYWLGIALSSLGPTYTDTARQAFSRASGVEGARLFHNDGPLIAARARARLVALGVAGP